MSVRMQKIILELKNFQNMMKKVFKNKKATVGLIILVFFAIVAIIGPLFATDDPLLEGSVPNRRTPIGNELSTPGWYKDLIGGNFTNNLYLTPDPTFSDPAKVGLWKNSTTDSGIHVDYNSSTGLEDRFLYIPNPSGIQITFTRDGNATISMDFRYPYQIPPTKYGIEWSYHVDTPYPQTPEQANFTVIFDFSYKIPGTNRTRVFPANKPFPLNVTENTWDLVPWYTASRGLSDLYEQNEALPIIFAKPRTYTLDVTVQLSRNVTAYGGNYTAYGNPKFYFDDLNVVLFGNSFGMLGTDNQARDIFTQLVIGTRISFVIGLVSAVVSVGIGLIVGLAAGYIGGATDEILMRFNDMLLVIPSLPLTIVFVFVLGPRLINIIIVVGLLGWMGFARTVRSAVLSLKERSFIEAVKSAGGGKGYIIRKHIVPNVFPLVYITLAMAVPGAIVTEAALSFLGLGPQDVMSWGRILRESEGAGTVAINAFGQWYWTIPPGICIALLSLSFVLIGYALDEILNPRLRER
jgi:peptide/nickel transport system permease protein